jgi:hypothetical protein
VTVRTPLILDPSGLLRELPAWDTLPGTLTAASQAEMESGTETALRAMSPLRVAQAVAALGGDGASVPISAATFTVADNTSVVAVDILDISDTLTVAGNLGVI